MPPGWDRLAVDAQAGSGESMLGYFRRALCARRRLAARLPDRIDWLQSPGGCWPTGAGRSPWLATSGIVPSSLL
jgi:hypothetical protein